MAGLPFAAGAASIDEVEAKAKPAIVRIEVLSEEGDGGRMVKQRGFGSGAIISPDGLVLTNHHVAGRGTRFRVTLADRQEIPAVLVGSDALTDLAVIRLDVGSRLDPAAPLVHATFGDSDALKVGDTVYALGSPAALSQSVTKGIVSNTAMISPKITPGLELDGERVGEIVRWIGHDAVIFGGNSGGPLVDGSGLIVGVNAVGIGSIGGAIPGNLARQVAAELVENGYVTRGWIGLEVQELLRGAADQRGVLVASVFEGGPAARAGLRPGDFLHRMNDEVIHDSRSPEDLPLFNSRIMACKPGASIRFQGLRGTEAMNWEVEVQPREARRAFEREFNEWGFAARPMTTMGAIELKRPDTQGVQVQSVRSGGPAAAAKPALAANDVITRLNDQEIRSMEDFLAFQKTLPDDGSEQPVVVAFERGVTREKLLTVVKVGPEREPQKPASTRKGWLGIQGQELGAELAEALGMRGVPGIRITRLIPAGPAEAAGLEPGDILTRLEDRPIAVRRPEDLRAFFQSIQSRQPGSTVKVDFLRSGETRSTEITLAAAPSDEDDAVKMRDADFEFAAIDLTDARRDAESLPAEIRAARVTSVTPNGWASLAGLRGNDLILAVDGQDIDGAKALETRLAALKEKRPAQIVFLVRRGVRHQFLQLEPSWPETK